MDPLKGIAASPGLVTGPAYVFVKDEVRATVRNVLDVAAQGDRLDAALRKASQEISAIRDRTAVQIGENEARVFDAHLLFLSDPTLVDTARDRIKEDKVAAEAGSPWPYTQPAWIFTSRPSSSTTVPLESETVTTLAPSCIAFSTAYWATLPEPETETRMPSKERPRCLSISSAK